MSATSFGAYAAWLAKHESKTGRKRRSLEAAEQAEEEKEAVDAALGVVAAARDYHDPYTQWVKRKETKLPLVKIVVPSPNSSIEAIVTREEDNGARRVADVNKKTSIAGRHQRDQATAMPQPSVTGKAPPVNKGKKRAATAELLSRDGKIARTTAVPTAAAQKKTESKDAVQPAAPVSCAVMSTQSRLGLPMIEEVRYWQDVDRFSFLA